MKSDRDGFTRPQHLMVAALVLVVLFVEILLLSIGWNPGMGRPPVAISAIALSVPLSLLYLYFGMNAIFPAENIAALLGLRRFVNRRSILTVVLIVVGVKLVHLYLSGNHQVGWLYRRVLADVLWTSIGQPGIFYVAHVLYFGPWFVLGALLWRPVCRLIHEYGVGLSLAVALAVLLSLGSESRHLDDSVPLVMPFVVRVTDSLGWRAPHYWLIGALALGLSKVWLTIGPVDGDTQLFPLQGYYLSHGPWMSQEMFLLQGAVVLAVSALIWRFWVWRRPLAGIPVDQSGALTGAELPTAVEVGRMAPPPDRRGRL